MSAQRALADVLGLHAMTLTTEVMKEFVFYIAHGPDIAGRHSALPKNFSSHEVHYMAVEDPDWTSFRDFAT